MADTPVVDHVGVHSNGPARGVLTSTWSAVAGVTTCLPLDAPNFPDKTFTATGTWGSATLVVEGSNDGTTYMTVNCLTATGEVTAASFTDNAVFNVIENPRYLRPRTTGGTSTALTIICTSQTTRR